jgi:fatty acid desaturase
MLLRHRADWRTLLWAFLLFPLGPLVGYSRPDLLPWLVPLLIYTSYCSGVLMHNHVHRGVFASRALNVVYGWWLSLFYGVPAFTWIPTHNQNHHRYLNGQEDRTRTTRLSQRDTLLHALVYPLASGFWQLPGIRDYLRRQSSVRPYVDMAVLATGHALLLTLAVGLHGLAHGCLVYAATTGIPALLAPGFMMFTNYVQHAGCDPDSADSHSRNFVSPFSNWLTFNGGFHTVHHEQPGLHWSLLPAAHAAREISIPNHLKAHSILSYCIQTYVGSKLRSATYEEREQRQVALAAVSERRSVHIDHTAKQ